MKAILESITDNSYSINAYHYERSAFEAPWHFHPQCELVYILEGKGTRYVGNSIELFEEGDFVMIAGNVPHCWKNPSDFKGNCHSIVVQWMENSIAVLPEYDTIAPVFWRAKQGLHILPSRSRKYKHLMNDITTLDPFARLLYFLTLLGELKNESEYKLLCDSEQEYKLSVSTNERLNKVYLYIENHFSEGLTLSDIAGEVNMGTESFSRFFSKAMNKSFFFYLNE